MKRIRHIIRQCLLLSIIIMTLAACSRGNAPMCVFGDDFGDIARQRVDVYSNGRSEGTTPATFAAGEWTDTGVDVYYPRSLQIRSHGSVELCLENYAAPVIRETITIPATQSGWVTTDIRLRDDIPNLRWKIISISGGFRESRGTDRNILGIPTGTSGRGGDYNNGDNLYVYIGDVTNKADNWYEDDGFNMSTSFPNFYELHNAGNARLVNRKPATTGRLNFRLKDTPGPFNSSSAHPWGDNFSDNYENGYVVVVEYLRKCSGHHGQFMQASIGAQGGLGTVQDMTEFATAATPGLFNGTAWATGRLWLRILDDPSFKWTGFGNGLIGDGNYTQGNNEGKYLVDITTTKPIDSGFSRVINSIIDPVKLILMGDPNATPPKSGLTKKMYLGVTGNIDYILGVRAAVALSIIFFAFSYMLGLTQIAGPQFIIYMIKLSIVFVLIGPNSWEFFYNYLFIFFMEHVEELIGIMSGSFTHLFTGITPPTGTPVFIPSTGFIDGANIPAGLFDIQAGQVGVIPTDVSLGTFIPVDMGDVVIPSPDPSDSAAIVDGTLGVYRQEQALGHYQSSGTTSRDAFAFLNQTISRFFNKETNIKIAGLLFGSPFGWIYVVLIYISMFTFMMAIAKAVLLYLLSIVMVSLMLFMAPIFFTFLLFPKLKGMFDSYIKILMDFSLQPVLIFAVISLFNVFIYSMLVMLLSFSVCWGCVWYIDFPFNDLLGVSENFDKICIFDGYKPWGMGNDQHLSDQMRRFPVSIFFVLTFFILCNAMDSFLSWAVQISNSLVAGGKSESLYGAASKAMSEGKGLAIAAATTAKDATQAVLPTNMIKGGLKAIGRSSANTSKPPPGGDGDGGGGGGGGDDDDGGGKASDPDSLSLGGDDGGGGTESDTDSLSLGGDDGGGGKESDTDSLSLGGDDGGGGTESDTDSLSLGGDDGGGSDDNESDA